MISYSHFNKTDRAAEVWTTALDLLTSPKPLDSVTAAYLMKYLVKTSWQSLSQALVCLLVIPAKPDSSDKAVAAMVKLLVDLLEGQMAVARVDLCKASRQGTYLVQFFLMTCFAAFSLRLFFRAHV